MTSRPSQDKIDLLTVLFSTGRYEEGEATARQMIDAWPNHGFGWTVLGTVLTAQQRFADALPVIQRSLAPSPSPSSDPETHNTLGFALLALGRSSEAESSYRSALEVKADFHEAHCNLGNTLQALGRPSEALACYRPALELKPDCHLAHNNLCVSRDDLGRTLEAEASYRRALELKPDFHDAHSNLLFTLNYTDKLSLSELFEEHLAWARCHEAPREALRRTHAPPRDAQRRLRIGYVSPDFRRHSVAFFIEPVLASHDRGAFEVYCYSNVANPDRVTQRLMELSDVTRSIVGMSDVPAADLVRADGIDILVDLAGHTARGRLGLFALKPAPVQVGYLGYPSTSGLSAIDWRFTDVHADPPGEGDEFYSERLVRLPETFLCYRPPEEAPEVKTPPSLENGHITFGSFNVLGKVTPQVIHTWAQLLDRVSGSRLLIKALGPGDPLGRTQVLGEFAQYGIGENRLTLLAKDAEFGAHLARYHEVDIGLDTFPYNGTTTSFEALWMGVPVVSLAGDRHAARVGASILLNLGLEELIARNAEQYLALAAALAGDGIRLAALRKTMRARMRASPLLDGPRLTRHIEAAYREMWRRWCTDHSLAHS